MKFSDKLTLLRKRNGLSQEQLGEKLNITIQEISEWELGQAKPDNDKLMEISKLLNIDFNVLSDDSLPLDDVDNNYNSNNTSTVVIDDDVRPRKWLLVVLVIVSIGLVIFLLNGYVTNKKSKEDKVIDFFGWFSDLYGIDDIDFDKKAFNTSFEFKTGTKQGTIVSSLLDDVITNNKTNKKHIITVIFGDLNSNDPNKIKDAKRSIETFDDYEISLDYDNDGFVNTVTIEKSEKDAFSDFDIFSFNSRIESHAGSNWGVSISNLIDDIITSNKKNPDKLIKVIYNNINTTDETEIRNIKKSLSDWTTYEVIIDYDDVGFINQITIEN